jgi:drug/metabolite transporter (DMT)-like permease
LNLKAGQILRIALAGLLLAIHYVMWFESLRFTSVASSTVLVSLQPLFSMIFGLLFLKEKISRSAGIGCFIAICGSFIIGWGDFQVSGVALFGDVVALLSAGVISLYFMIGQVVRKEIGVVTYSVVSYLSSVFFLLIYALLRGDALTGYSITTWGAFLGIAIVATIGGQFVFNLLLKKVSATAVTMTILGEPIGTCILAYFILSESITFQQLIGFAVIMAGLIIYFFRPGASKE